MTAEPCRDERSVAGSYPVSRMAAWKNNRWWAAAAGREVHSNNFGGADCASCNCRTRGGTVVDSMAKHLRYTRCGRLIGQTTHGTAAIAPNGNPDSRTWSACRWTSSDIPPGSSDAPRILPGSHIVHTRLFFLLLLLLLAPPPSVWRFLPPLVHFIPQHKVVKRLLELEIRLIKMCLIERSRRHNSYPRASWNCTRTL